MDVIQKYLRSTEKVNSAALASPDGPSDCLHTAGGMLAGQNCCPPGVLHYSKPSNALGLLDTVLPTHTPSLSFCGSQDELLKMMFLESICNICKVSSKKDSCEGLAVFCHENNLAEKIKVRGQYKGLWEGAELPSDWASL